MNNTKPTPSDTAPDRNPVALVTGASKRIGRAIAFALAGAGWEIAVHYHSSRDQASSVVDAIEALGRNATLLPADLSDAEATRSLVPRCCETLGAPSCLVNNASLFEPDELASLSLASWDSHIDTNLRAPVLLSQSFAAHLPEDRQGVIINITDQRTHRPAPDFFSYSTSKAGLWWVTQTMAQALAPRIRVNAVGPGPVLPSIHQTDEEFDEEMKSTLLQRSAPPEDIAQAVLYLASARSVTGQMLTVDSGQHLAR